MIRKRCRRRLFFLEVRTYLDQMKRIRLILPISWSFYLIALKNGASLFSSKKIITRKAIVNSISCIMHSSPKESNSHRLSKPAWARILLCRCAAALQPSLRLRRDHKPGKVEADQITNHHLTRFNTKNKKVLKRLQREI